MGYLSFSIIILMILIMSVVLLGVAKLGFGKKINKTQQNRLMTLRVTLQAVVIALIGIIYYVNK